MDESKISHLIGEPQEFVTAGEGKYKVWWSEKEGFVRFRGIGKIDEEFAKRDVADVVRIGEQHAGGVKVSLLADTTLIPSFPSLGAIKVYKAFANHPIIQKIALFGMAPVKKLAFNFFITRVGGLKTMKSFGAEEEALRWLEEKT